MDHVRWLLPCLSAPQAGKFGGKDGAGPGQKRRAGCGGQDDNGDQLLSPPQSLRCLVLRWAGRGLGADAARTPCFRPRVFNDIFLFSFL